MFDDDYAENWSAAEDPFYPPHWCVVEWYSRSMSSGWRVIKTHLTEAEAKGWAEEFRHQREERIYGCKNS